MKQVYTLVVEVPENNAGKTSEEIDIRNQETSKIIESTIRVWEHEIFEDLKQDYPQVSVSIGD